MMRPEGHTDEQIAAARLRMTLDAKRGRPTPQRIRRLAAKTPANNHVNYEEASPEVNPDTKTDVSWGPSHIRIAATYARHGSPKAIRQELIRQIEEVEGRANAMSPPEEAERVVDRRLCVAVAVEGHGGFDSARQFAQGAVEQILHEARERTEIAYAGWEWITAGDEQVILLPEGTAPAAIEDFIIFLNDAIDAENRHVRSSGLLPRLRLRIAMHEGEVDRTDNNSFTGKTIVDLLRLLHAQQFRDVMMSTTRSALGVVISDHLFRIRSRLGPTTLRMQRLTLNVKPYAVPAWLYLSDDDVHQLELPDTRERADDTSDEASLGSAMPSEPGPDA